MHERVYEKLHGALIAGQLAPGRAHSFCGCLIGARKTNLMAVLIDTTGKSEARAICVRFDNKPDALLEILHAVQKADGYLADGPLREIADALNISRAEIHGVVSFYHDYYRTPPAKHIIKLCRAEACQAVGSEDLASYAKSKIDIMDNGAGDAVPVGVADVYCLGNCALGPAAMVDDKLFARMTPEKLDAIVTVLIENRS